MEGMYERQQSLAIDRDQSVAIIGIGGVGNWLALSLALAGVNRLILFDNDTISSSNLNRFPLPASKVGQPKAGAMAGWLEYLRPDIAIRSRAGIDEAYLAEQEKDRASYNLVNLDWVVACTDSLKSRQLAKRLAVIHNASYLEIGADGNGWSLSPAPPEFSTELEDRAGYTSVPVFVGPCMMAAAAASYFILHGVQPVQSIRGDWDRLDPSSFYMGLKIATMMEVEIPRPEATVGDEIIAQLNNALVTEAEQVNYRTMTAAFDRGMTAGDEPDVVMVNRALDEAEARLVNLDNETDEHTPEEQEVFHVEETEEGVQG